MKDEGGRMNEGRQTERASASSFPNDSSFILHPSSLPRYYQLTHDYLVHSLRDWLTRKQRATRRGRAELRLAERSALWSAKPENRHLPSVPEWASIQTLTRKRDWSEIDRRMMKRAGRFHGIRTLGAAVMIALAAWIGIEDYGTLRTTALVESLRAAETASVAPLIKQLAGYRRRADRPLRAMLAGSDESSRDHLHASLALLPWDDGQVEYLSQRLTGASADDIAVLRDALKAHQANLIPKLWRELESPGAGDTQVLAAASALALYDSQDQRWAKAADNVAGVLVRVNATYLRPWLDALRPVRARLLAPLAAIFRDQKRSESEYTQATSILTDYAGDDPGLIADLLMHSGPKAYLAFFPIAQTHAAKVLPLFQGELARKPEFSWSDRPLDPSWTNPDALLVSKLDASGGMLSDRFAFCQTMPLDQFVTTVEELRKSGYRPIRFRPYADEKVVRVAAVWARDGRKWRIAWGQSTEQVRQHDDKSYIPVDISGYVAAGSDGKPADQYAAVWVEKEGPDDDDRMFVAVPAAELAKVQEQLQKAGMAPATLLAFRDSKEQTTYCGISRKSASYTASVYHNGLGEGTIADEMVAHAGITLIDMSLGAAAPPVTTKERATAALRTSGAALQAKPDDQNARFARASAYFQLADYAKAIDDLTALIKHAPQRADAFQLRAIAHARPGHKNEARADLAEFQKSDATASSKLYLAVVVAAELGEGFEPAFEKMAAALQEQPGDSGFRYDAACALALAARAIAPKDPAKGRALADRAIALLKSAIESGYSDYNHMQEDSDLDPIRDRPEFDAIMKAGRLDRAYSAIWDGAFHFEAKLIHGPDDPAAHLLRCRELAAQGYRMVSLSAGRTSPGGQVVTASVWHRPPITEQARDQLAERQARAAVALVRLGRSEQVWPLLQHSPDPRLRSFIINWLKPLGADAAGVATELAQRDSTEREARSTPRPPRPSGEVRTGCGGVRGPERVAEGRLRRLPHSTWTPSSSTPRPPSAAP